MPILASLGTANDRAFGFGDSSFASGYDLPAIITNNAEIIYDASNPESVVTGNFEPEFLGSQKITFLNWKFFFPKDTPVVVGDYVGMSEVNGSPVIPAVYFNQVIGITPHPTDPDAIVVEVDYSGLAYLGITKAMISPVVGVNRWYDISGNNNHATWSATPTLSGAGANQYLIANSSARLTVPSVLTYQDGGFDLIAVWKVTGSADNINGVGWKSALGFVDYHLSFDSEGSGGFGNTSVDSPGYVTSAFGQYVMHWARVGLPGSSANVVNKVNDGSGGITADMLYGASGIGSNSCVIGTNGTTELKLILIYPAGTAPTNSNAYNALKGRFGL
jgi:hypothetical protein